MYALQYFDGKEWVLTGEPWSNWELGWSSLGTDTLNYRIVDKNNKVMKENVPSKIQKFKSWITLSSQVKTTSYNEEEKWMIVEFANGGRYRYEGVPLDTWKLSLITTSIGKFINTTIKPNYEVKKLN